MRVGILGINHKLADLKLRELLAKICQQRLGPDQSAHGEHSFVLLSTCNRTEIYFSSDEVAHTHSYLLNILKRDLEEDFDQKLYTFFGQDCLTHLCRVAAGLDSAVIAETEIQGQVKAAYEKAHAYQKLPFALHYLFQKSLGIAKRARGILPLKPGLPDIEHAVFQTGEQIFESGKDAQILFVGASRTNEKIIAHFKSRQLKNLTLCNRTSSNAERLAKEYQIGWIEWKELSTWHLYDWVIFATNSPHYLIRNHSPYTFQQTKLLIDLSVPRNVDPQLQQNENVLLLNIDQINQQLEIRKQKMSLSLSLAEEMILRAADHQHRLFLEKNHLRDCVAIA